MTDTVEDLRRDDARRHDEYYMPEPCPCGGEWDCIGSDSTYGADADGRRGTWLYEWECTDCGEMITTQGQ